MNKLYSRIKLCFLRWQSIFDGELKYNGTIRTHLTVGLMHRVNIEFVSTIDNELDHPQCSSSMLMKPRKAVNLISSRTS